jgi:hypothetical protein
MFEVKPDRDGLFDEIGSFLATCRERSKVQASRDFWGRRVAISTREMQVLAGLGRSPACPAVVARRLGRDVEAAAELLEALAAFGLVERRGELYIAAPALLLYCASQGVDPVVTP